MKERNFPQLVLVKEHQPWKKVAPYVDQTPFPLYFLSHVTEYIKAHHLHVSLSDPLLDPDFKEDSTSSLRIHGVEVGSIRLLYHSNPTGASLMYFSPSGLITSTLLEERELAAFTVSDYVQVVVEWSEYLLFWYRHRKKNEE